MPTIDDGLYIGDGLYVKRDGGQIEIRVNSLNQPPAVVFLDGDTYYGLKKVCEPFFNPGCDDSNVAREEQDKLTRHTIVEALRVQSEDGQIALDGDYACEIAMNGGLGYAQKS